MENNELSLESLEEVSGGFQEYDDFLMEQMLKNQEQNRQEMEKIYGSPSAKDQAKREEASQKLKETILRNAYNIANGAAGVRRKPWK